MTAENAKNVEAAQGVRDAEGARWCCFMVWSPIHSAPESAWNGR